jgi:L-aspartate oxidase
LTVGAAIAADGMPACDEVRVSDVLIVGTGAAGLAAALGCAGRQVTVLTKTRLGEGGSSAWAQGGVAAALGTDDSPALHAADTLAVAGGLGDARRVDLLTTEGPARMAELVRLGAAFDRADGAPDNDRGPAADRAAGTPFALGREAAHSRRRILHAGGDATGRELVRALTDAVRRAPNVRVEEECFAVDLVVEPAARQGGSRVAGLLALDRDGRRVLHLAGATVLATGGSGQLYLHTTNPPEVTADGLAMAARAGARLADLEFVQFHPTALAVAGGGRLPLLTEALRGEGAVLVDGAGRRFMLEEHPLAELAPRDVVARAIHRRLAAGEGVFLDARVAIGDRFPERFPTVFQAARDAGLDPRREPLPVVPAAHYHMGGVVTDERGRTSLPGLWACGETAATGVHGANRLASNSLLEALVFGARVAGDLARRLAAVPRAGEEDLARLRLAGAGGAMPAPRREARAARTAQREGETGSLSGGGGEEAAAGNGLHRQEEIAAAGDLVAIVSLPRQGGAGEAAEDGSRELARRAAALRRRLRERMWADVGLVRDAAGLARAADELRRLEGEVAELVGEAEQVAATGAAGGLLRDLLETRNLITAGALITAAAELRRESRGAHHRLDHPSEDADWRRRVLVTARPGVAPLLALSAAIADAAAVGQAERAAGAAAAPLAGRFHGVMALRVEPLRPSAPQLGPPVEGLR